MFRARHTLARLKLLQTRKFCTKPSNTNDTGDKIESSVSKYNEAYRQLDNLDFMSATKILFSDPPKKKKFGIDFHLVQLFFVCLPSLAVYLVAQYARREMRKMDAELELKKKDEEAKAKEMEAKAIEEKEAGSAELLEVKVRLDKLEETLKKILAVESKKQPSDMATRKQEDSKTKNEHQDGSAPLRSKSGKPAEKNQVGKPKTEEIVPRVGE